MRIAVDTQALFSPVFRGRGIANYLHNQLNTMFRQDKENEYILFNLYSEESALDTYFSGIQAVNVREFQLYTGKEQFLIQDRDEAGLPQFRSILKGIIQNFLRENEIDVFFFASPFDHWNYLETEWFDGVKTLATVYDIIPYVMPDVYLQNPAEKAEYLKKIELLRSFDKILAISQSVKDDLVEHLSFKPEQIDVVYAGISPFYKKGEVTGEEAAHIRQKYGIQGEYLFVAGGCDPRKNMPETIRAYSKLPAEIIDKYQLVFVCKMAGGYPDLLRGTAEQCGLAENRVVLTDFVPDEDIVPLYRMARLTVFASRYEGFGLPIIESMACGTPVVTSENSSLGEVAQGAAVLVNPMEIDSIAEGLYRALSSDNDVFLREMDGKVKIFTWDNSSDLTLKTLKSLNTVKNAYVKPDKKEAKCIAVFAPLPPLQSGIADYTAEFLQALDRKIRIDVFIDDGYTPAKGLPENVTVHNHCEYVEQQDKYDLTIYQMGNNHLCHYYMLPYIRQFGGTVELHDVNLHNMLQHKAFEIDGDLPTYRQYLAEDYPDTADIIVQELERTGKPPAPETLLLNGAVTNYADNIIVHSQYARETLLAMDIANRVTVVPLFVTDMVYEEQKVAKKALGIAQSSTVVATFGAISETRRLEPLLKAFAEVDLPDTTLFITGGFLNPKLEQRLKQLVQTLGLEEKVHITGRLSEPDMQRYIAACDICINLRWPYHGENSAIVGRLLHAGKTVVVTDVGSFAELPDDLCIKVPVPVNDGVEEDTLAATLATLVKDQGRRNKVGERAQAYAKQSWAPQKLAAKIVRAALGVENPHKKCLREDDLCAVSKEITRTATGREKYEIMKISETLAYVVAK